MKLLPDKFKKINPKYTAIMAFGIPVALVAAFVYFVYVPYNKANSALQEQIQKNESEITQGQVMQRKLNELKAANLKLQDELKVATMLLPTGEEGAKLPETISEMAKSAGLTVTSVTPGQKVPGPSGLYFENPIAVEASGSYHDVGKLMEGVDKITRLLTVSDLNMSSAKTEGLKIYIPVKFTLLAFTSGGGK